MNSHRRVRRRASVVAESLEARNLLNAHVPSHPAAHVAHIAALPSPTPPPISTKPPKPLPPPPLHPPKAPKAPHEISGTVTGLSTYTLNPNNGNQGYDVYNASAPAKGGVAEYIGTDSFTSRPISPTTYSDTYFNGFTVLYLAGNNDVSISYVGTGHSPVQNNGNYTATLTGEAIGITGFLTGHEYSFKATVAGNETTDAVTIKFTLKE